MRNKTSLSLLTDLYQLTMSYGYFKNNYHNTVSTFHLFFRKTPFQGNYAIACGLSDVTEILENFKFNTEDIEYLAKLEGNDGKGLFDNDFLNYLEQLEFSCDVDAVCEGEVVFAHQPLLRITGPIIQCQILETILLNVINFQTLIATKASRLVESSNGDPILEFGLRRAQGIDGALSASRSSYIGGVDSTSNVLAGKLFDIPVKGTHAHSWVMSFPNELEAFELYAKVMPNNCVFLVDTFDSIEGIKNAITMAHKLKERGHSLIGIRLDSGDLTQISISARKMLDDEGLYDAKIIASNDLDEYEIERLKELGAKIDIWGVGTKLVSAYDQPALGGVYKLGAIHTSKGIDYKLKISNDIIKISNPGILQIKRFYENGFPIADMIYDLNHNSKIETPIGSLINGEKFRPDSFKNLTSKDLLLPIFKNGVKVLDQFKKIQEIRQYKIESLTKFNSEIRSNKKTNTPYPILLEKSLHELKDKIITNIKKGI